MLAGAQQIDSLPKLLVDTGEERDRKSVCVSQGGDL